MNKRAKFVSSFIVFGSISTVVFMFIFLMRGCLSKEDEYVIPGKTIAFEKDNKQYIMYILNYEKCTSYSSSGGMSHKSVSPYFYIQIRNCENMEVVQNIEIEENDKDLNSFNTKILGKSGNIVWYYAGELLGFDLNTFKTTVTIKTLEEKNPQMKDMFPTEVNFYKFDYQISSLIFSSRKGIEMRMKNDLKVVENNTADINKQLKAKLEAKETKYNKMADSLRILKVRKMDLFFKYRDSANLVSEQKRNIENLTRYITEKNNKINEFMGKNITDFRSISTNGFILDSTIYCLLNQDDITKFNGNFYFRSGGYDNKNCKVYSAKITKPFQENESYLHIKEYISIGDFDFLNGFILLEYSSLNALLTDNNKSFIVISKKFIEDSSPFIISKVGLDAKVHWNCELVSSEINDVVIDKDFLVIITKHDKENDNNFVNVIDLKTGKLTSKDLKEDFKK